MTTLDKSSQGLTRIENLPDSLQEFNCGYNGITRIENLPDSLQQFRYYNNPIEFVDNLGINEYKSVFDYFRVKDYTNIKKCSRTITNYKKRQKEAATVITQGCHNWIWKPLCNDGTIGIRPRLDTRDLGISL